MKFGRPKRKRRTNAEIFTEHSEGRILNEPRVKRKPTRLGQAESNLQETELEYNYNPKSKFDNCIEMIESVLKEVLNIDRIDCNNNFFIKLAKNELSKFVFDNNGKGGLCRNNFGNRLPYWYKDDNKYKLSPTNDLICNTLNSEYYSYFNNDKKVIKNILLTQQCPVCFVILTKCTKKRGIKSLKTIIEHQHEIHKHKRTDTYYEGPCTCYHKPKTSFSVPCIDIGRFRGKVCEDCNSFLKNIDELYCKYFINPNTQYPYGNVLKKFLDGVKQLKQYKENSKRYSKVYPDRDYLQVLEMFFPRNGNIGFAYIDYEGMPYDGEIYGLFYGELRKDTVIEPEGKGTLLLDDNVIKNLKKYFYEQSIIIEDDEYLTESKEGGDQNRQRTSFGKKKRKTVKRKVKRKTKKKRKVKRKVTKRPNKRLREKAKRLKIRLTLKKNGKRVYKTESKLKQQIETKSKRKLKRKQLKTKRSKRSKNN